MSLEISGTFLCITPHKIWAQHSAVERGCSDWRLTRGALTDEFHGLRKSKTYRPEPKTELHATAGAQQKNTLNLKP